MSSKSREDLNSAHIELKDNFCETMEEVINSEDFKRVFKIVLQSSKKYNFSYFSKILGKIKKDKNLNKEEKQDILELLTDEKIMGIADNIVSRLNAVNMTMYEAKKFLELYPLDDVIDSLKEKINIKVLYFQFPRDDLSIIFTPNGRVK